MATVRTILGFPIVLVGTLITRLGEWVGGGVYSFDAPYDRYHDQRALELGEGKRD